MKKISASVNMTEGNILKSMLYFSFPILIGNLFQQLYNVTDTAVVGNLLGDNAIAAVGAAAPIYSLVISFANGITNGFSVIIARFFGADNREKMLKAISISYILTLVISLILTVVSLIGLDPLLKFLETPIDIIDDTRAYLRTILMFCVVTMFYNMFAGMFRAIGNSSMPLYFLIIATLINVVLDYTFVKYLNLGVVGVGYATVIAQSISVILCLISILSKYKVLSFRKSYAKIEWGLTGDLLVTGFSMGLMLVVVSIGSVALQNAVNSLGSKTITAHTAARKFDELFMLPLGTLSMVGSTFASQNFGAGKMDRVKKGIITAILLGIGWGVFTFVFALIFSPTIVKALTGTSDPYVLNTAVRYITINTPFFAVLSILLILRSSLQGLGRKTVPIFASVIELIAKFVAAIYIAPIFGYLGICFLEPAIWVICAIIVLIEFMVFIGKEIKKAAV